MNVVDENKREEPLAGLLTGMLGGQARGRVLRLKPEQQLRRRWPLAVAAAAAALVTLLALLGVAASLYRRSVPSPAANRVAAPVVQPVPGAAPPPKAFVAIAPPPPAPSVRRRPVIHPANRPHHAIAPPPRRMPWDREFAPAEEAYGPYPAVPLSREALRRVLVEDRRRTRELNNRELDYLDGP